MTLLLEAVPFGRAPLPVVLFDANVLFQSAATRFLLGGARGELYRAVWTSDIVEEARRNLVKTGRLGGLAALDQNLRYVDDPTVDAASPRQTAALQATDAADRHVLAAAIRHSASVLVTDNVRDFSADEAEAGGVVIATARGFALQLVLCDARAMDRLIERVPPERFERYIATLKRQLPEAVEALGL